MSEEKDLEKTELVQSDVEAEKGENETVKTEKTVENVEETEVKETEKVEEDKTVEEKPDDSDDQTGELIGETPVAQEMPQNASVPENMGGVAPAIPADKPKKVKKPLSKGAIAGIVAGGVALVAAVVCGIIFLPKLFKPAKDVVIDAAKETFTFTDEKSYVEELVDVDTIVDTYYAEGGSVNYELTIDSIAGEEAFSGLTLSVDDNYDPVNELANATIALLYNDVDLLTVNSAIDSENMYFMLANAAETYFSLPTEEPFIALQNSPLGQEMGLTGAPSYNFDFFSYGNEEVEVNSDYVDAVAGIWDSAVFEKQKGKAKVTVNGKDVTTKEYYITISEEDIKASIESAIDGFIAYVTADQAMLDEMQMDAATVEMYAGFIKPELLSMFNEDLVIKVYIKKDKIVKITNNYTISYGGYDITTDFYVDIDDKDMSGALKLNAAGDEVGILVDVKDVYGNANGSITAYAGDEEMVCEFESTIEDTDSEESQVITGSVFYDDTAIITFATEELISKDDDTFSINVECSVIDGDTEVPCNILVEGGYADVEAGKKYTVNFDTIDVSVMDEQMVTMSGSYTIDTTEVNAVTVDSSQVCDLTSASVEDIENIVMDNQNKIINWVKDIILETGEFGELLDEYLFDGELSSYLQFF